ncbi:MAG: TrkH family potassium uptake protein [Candidatus Margulisbacteria bacterium]|nr:TrkH family potassium uptake protein [Candidatus Margulisiibacteriota bacterium]
MRWRPSLIIALSFLLVIITGSILLSLPISSAKGISTNYLDAYFTANSATCVTGLVVLDTGTHFSLFGLFVILCMIQIGGLGYMTFSTFLVMVFRKKMFISDKMLIMEALNIYSSRDVVAILRKIFGIVFVVEGIGAIILFLRWLPELGAKKALLYGVFHSVSAFNNAGFALPANFANLSPYVTDWTINLTITSLIIIGGIGFLVIADILQFRRWSLHSKLAVTTTLILIVCGTIAYFFLEYNSTLASLALPNKMLASYFQAVTPRTAGFNTLDMGKILPATGLIVIFLMFVGANPGGTGGGIKTTTFALVASTIWATLRNSRDTILFNRRVPAENVRRAFAITILSLVVISIPIFVLTRVENFGIMPVAFETVSAFGTVGLSMGITPMLSSVGKIIIIIVMYVGRVGPLTLLLALASSQKDSRIEPPKEGVSIG